MLLAVVVVVSGGGGGGGSGGDGVGSGVLVIHMRGVGLFKEKKKNMMSVRPLVAHFLLLLFVRRRYTWRAALETK